ncbi:hypothetical protein GE09DRAFT_967654 [Coniochaeta sp. 2T2.1]|nr:hypothetical protein GE09DRAFT_967654 [Coniochaeta sp. 2T2.1]
MSSTASASILRASRPLFRPAQFTRHAGFRSSNPGKRWQSTTAEAEAAAKASWFKRMWDSPIGLKTVHFWAPVMKWSIVLAGVADFARPAEKLSLTQNGALTATGLIWTRWCLIIKPKNYLLAAVNFFLGVVGIVQVTRILLWQQSQKHKSPVEKIEDKVEEVVKA